MAKSDKSEKTPRRFTRRAILAGGAAALFGSTAVGAYARYVEPFWPEWTSHDMPLPNLDRSLAGLRILHLTDLHVDSRESEQYLMRQLDLCTARKPDLIILTGDYITGGNPASIAGVRRVVRRLRARLGIFASLGNHDYYDFTGTLPRTTRYSGIVAQELSQTLTSVGVRVLRNESFVLPIGGAKLQFVGLEDWLVDRYDGARAFSRAIRGLPTIALSHNPDTILDLRNRECHWVLSGHTHGGQVRIPGIGAIRLPITLRKFDQGLFDEAGRKLYVNRGIGYLRPVRFNCRPEIAEFTLTRA